MDIKTELETAFADIKFDEGPHTYSDSHKTPFTSVTTWLHGYSKPFDAKAVAAKKTTSKEDMEALLKQWELGKEYACHFGTQLHLVMENLWARKVYQPIALNDEMKKDFAQRVPQCQSAVDFLRLEGYVPVATEFVICDRLLGLAGCVDAIFYNTRTNRLVIADWKTNKQIRKTGYKGATLNDKLSTFQDCELGKYSVQLNVYADIIERNTSLKVDELFLVHFPPEGKDFVKIGIERTPIFTDQEKLSI